MEASEAKPKRRLRISLLSLFLITALVALSMALWRERQSTGVYRREIAGLRREVGQVVVADPTKLTVQPLDDSVDSWRHFRWRAYTPPGQYGEVELTIASDKKPLKRRRATLRLGPGEMNFDVSAFQHPGGGAWMYWLRQPFASGGGVIAAAPPWIGAGVSMRELFDPKSPPQAIAEGETLELLRFDRRIENGEQVEVVITVKHFASGKQPNSSSSASTEPVPASLPNR